MRIVKINKLKKFINEQISGRIKLRNNSTITVLNMKFFITLDGNFYELYNEENNIRIFVSKKPKELEYQGSMGMLGPTHKSWKISVGYEYSDGERKHWGNIDEIELRKTIENIIARSH